jgi:hypothetical protein
VTGKASTAGTGRVLERRRAVALAQHYREFEGLSIGQIAERLGRSRSTVKAYFYDPTGREGAGRQGPLRRRLPRLRRLHATAQRQGRRVRLLQGLPSRRDRAALDAGARDLGGRERYGRMPSSYDWSRTHARRRGERASQRLAAGHWPSASIVSALFGTWAGAREAVAGAKSPAATRALNGIARDHAVERGIEL